MAIAHDSEILGAANTATPYTTAITPTNPPSGVCVVIVQDTAADLITAVTYGGVGLIRRRFNTEATEPGAVYIYWGAATFPSGAQNVVVTRTGTASMRAAISTMTVAAGKTIDVDADASGTSASVANPSWTMNTTTATNTCCYEGIWSGLNAMTNTPATGWTLAPTPGFVDFGTQGQGWARRTFTGGALTCGWIAATADDFVGCSIAFKEVPPPTAPSGPVHAVQGGRQTNPGREAPQYL